MRKLLSLMLLAAVSIISSTAQIVTSTSITRTFRHVEEPPKPAVPKAWNHSGIFIGGNWASIPSYELNGLKLPGVSAYGFELGYRLLFGNTKIGGFSWNICKLQLSSNGDETLLYSITTGFRYDSPRILGGISLYGSFDFGVGEFDRPSEIVEGGWLYIVQEDPHNKLTEIAVGVKLSRHFSIGVSVQSQAAYISGATLIGRYYDFFNESTTLSVPTVKFEYLF